MNVRIESLHHVHRLSGVHAVRGASLAIEAGECVGLIGPNGAGKSTLLACVLGFLLPRRGRVRLAGRPPDDLGVRSRTGFLSEAPAFPGGLTARGALELHHALAGRPYRTRRQETDALLARVGLAAAADRRPSAFSSGMRQRLGLACALIGEPDLLVLDEPATGLDPPGAWLLSDEIRAATCRGATVLLSSHQLDEVERSCSRIALLRAGAIVADVPMRELAAGPRVLRVRLALPAGEGRAVDAGAVARAASSAGASLLSLQGGVARAMVADDGAAARLVAGLGGAGLGVLEVVPERSRLEQLFHAERRP